MTYLIKNNNTPHIQIRTLLVGDTYQLITFRNIEKANKINHKT